MRGALLRLAAITILTQTAVYLVRPLLTYRALDFGAGELAVGALVVAYTLCPAVAALPVGRACDLRGAPPVIRAGLALLAIGGAVLVAAPSLPLLFAGTFVMGLGSLAVMVATQAAVARLVDRDGLDAGFGLVATAISLGQMIGPVAGGLLAGDASAGAVRQAFGAAAVLCLVALPLTRFSGAGSRESSQVTAKPGRSRALLSHPGVLASIVVSASILGAVDLVIAYLPLIGERVGIEPAAVGLLLGARAAASVLSRAFIPVLLRHMRSTTLLVVSLMISGAALPVLAVAQDVWVMAAVMVVAGFFLGLGQPLTMAMVVRSVPVDDQGVALAVRFSGTKVGQVSMAGGVALLTGLTGPAGALVGVGAVLLISAFASVVAGRSGRID